MPWSALAASMVLALLAGSLLRLSQELSVPALRMFGFWSLVAIGVILARAAARQQVAEARRALEEALRGLGPGFLAAESGPGLLALVAPAGVLALAVEDMPQYGRGPLARRRQMRALERARRAAARAAAVLAREAEVPQVPVVPVLVQLRRRAAGDQGSDGVIVVNPEGIAVLAGRFAAPALLDEEARRRLADALAAGLTAGEERWGKRA